MLNSNRRWGVFIAATVVVSAAASVGIDSPTWFAANVGVILFGLWVRTRPDKLVTVTLVDDDADDPIDSATEGPPALQRFCDHVVPAHHVQVRAIDPDPDVRRRAGERYAAAITAHVEARHGRPPRVTVAG